MRVYVINLKDFQLRDCHCPQRNAAQQAEEFFYVPLYHGYVWADKMDVPRRKDGRKFVWVTCPFCGGDISDRGELGW